jgi:hypothetical protein
VVAGQQIPAHLLGTLSYQPVAEFSGGDGFTWNGSDGLAYAAAGATVDMTVAAVNDAPVNTMSGVFAVDEDASRSGLVFGIDDVDAGAATTFRFSLSAASGVLTVTSTGGLTLLTGSNGSHQLGYRGTLTDVNAALANVTYAPDANFNGGDVITLNANDAGNTGTGGALQDTDPLTVTVNPVNDAPALTPMSLKTGDEEALISFSAAATDIDAGQSAAFTLVAGAPAGATLDPASGVFAWTPTESDSPGVYTLTVRVTDNGMPPLSDTDSVEIVVNEINDAPIFTGGASPTVNEDSGPQRVRHWASAISPGPGHEASQALVFHASASHAALFSSPPVVLAPSGDLTFTPAANLFGSAVVTVTLQDDGGTAYGGVDTSAAYIFTVTVSSVNDAPAFTSTPFLTATEDSLYRYGITTADVDVGDTHTFELTSKPAWLTLIDRGDGRAMLRGTPTNAAVGPNPVAVRVVDSAGGFAVQTFNISVANVNDAPSFTSIAPTTAMVGVAYSYAITTGDPDSGDTRILSVRTAPAWLALSDHHNGTATLHGTPAAADVGTAPVVVRVQDAGGLTAEQEFSLTVAAPLQFGSVTGVVFADTDGDGMQDAAEPGVADVTVTLQDTQFMAAGTTLVRQTVTDAQGVYRFDEVPAGSYVLRFTAPAGFFLPPPGTMDVTVQVGQVTTASGCPLLNAQGELFLPNLAQ